MDRLLIIDGNALVHRAFHALPPLKTKKGEIVNAVYGFLLVLFKAIEELSPKYAVACFDLKGPTFRHEQFKEYKAQRKKAPDELYEQIEKVKKVLTAFDIPIFEKQGFEADDLIGSIACFSAKDNKNDIEAIIVSGDMDNLQLVNDKIKVYTLRKGVKDTILYNEKQVKEKYDGLSSAQLVDFKGLRGDPSDNIPGVTGIGEKTAIDLLKQFNSLEELYQAIENDKNISEKIKPSVLEKLKRDKDQAFLSKKLAEIDCHIETGFDLVESTLKNFNSEKAQDALRDFEFYSLLGKLPLLTGIKEKKEIRPALKQRTRQQAEVQGLLLSSVALKEENILDEINRLESQGALSGKIAEVEREIVPIVKDMEKAGIKVDLKKLKVLSGYLDKELNILVKSIFALSKEEFNINSSQQLSHILFEKLRINPLGMKKTPKGVISTGASELNKIKSQHKIIELILQYRELFKLKTGFVDSLAALVSVKDGRIHPHFHQLGTETGRMSCSAPNLQNIPVKTETGKKIRDCFVADDNCVFLSADYSQVELRIAASIAHDKVMLEAFNNNEDIHTSTAAEIFDVPKDKVSKEMRGLAKTLNFGVLYGMGYIAFSERVGIEKIKAKEFIKKYFEEFASIAEYVKTAKEKVKETGFVETIFGRKRFLTEIDSFDPRIRAQAERMAINMPIQGSSADIIKMAMAELSRKKVLDRSCKLILQIHDELLFEVEKDKAKKKIRAIKEVMENAVDINIALKVKVEMGKTWGELS